MRTTALVFDSMRACWSRLFSNAVPRSLIQHIDCRGAQISQSCSASLHSLFPAQGSQLRSVWGARDLLGSEASERVEARGRPAVGRCADINYERTCSQLKLLKRWRNCDFSNLPVEVCGNSSRKTKSSGSCHLANLSHRKMRNSSLETRAPSCSTTQASGRSCHLGCGIATTAASLIAGCPTNAFSRSTELIHSPPDLIRSLVRSVIFM